MDKHCFLMQIDEKEDFLFDFQFELYHTVNNLQKIGKAKDFYFVKKNLPLSFYAYKNIIPVGSVEFVTDFIKNLYNKQIKPLNVPEELRGFEFSKRNIYLARVGEKIPKGKFVKSAEKIKLEAQITSCVKVFSEDVLVSDLIDINSEWRVFVSNKKVRGIRHYSGDFYDCPPSQGFVEKCIEVFTKQPKVWTLDIGKNKHGEFVIECHDFFSCGLYGFSDINLPTMFTQWFYEFVRKND